MKWSNLARMIIRSHKVYSTSFRFSSRSVFVVSNVDSVERERRILVKQTSGAHSPITDVGLAEARR